MSYALMRKAYVTMLGVTLNRISHTFITGILFFLLAVIMFSLIFVLVLDRLRIFLLQIIGG